jgi:hypothetical protein
MMAHLIFKVAISSRIQCSQIAWNTWIFHTTIYQVSFILNTFLMLGHFLLAIPKYNSWLSNQILVPSFFLN